MNQQRGSPTMNANLPFTIVLWTATALNTLCLASACGQAPPQMGSMPSVENFLNENGLPRLLLTYRETQASNATGDRAAMTEQLQRAYAMELFKPVADLAWAKQLLIKAKISLSANPIRQSQRLRLAVAHREVLLMRLAFFNGESVVGVDQIINDLNSIQRGVKLQIDDLERLSQLQQSSLGDEVRLQDQRQLQRHGEYLLGWSYFLQSASQQHQDKQMLRDAESYFRAYLDLPPYLNLTKFSEDKFGKENRFQRSATVGLAVVMQAIGAEAQSKHCFAVAEANAKSIRSSNREIKIIERLKLIGLLNQGDFAALETTFVDQPERLSDSVLLNAILNRPETSTELTSLALIQLTLNFQSDQLQKTIELYPEAFSKLGQTGLWIRGYLQWEDYQQRGEPQKLQLATESLQEAENDFGEETRPAIEGHCRFLLASCRYEQKKFLAATKGFLSATKLLENFDRDLAAQSAYRAFQSSHELPDEQRQIAETTAVRQMGSFPQSRFAQLTKFELTLDRLKGESNSDAIEYLSRYRTGDRSDLVVSAATVEIARRYQASPESEVQGFREFVEATNDDDRISTPAKIETNYYYLSALLDLPIDQTNSAYLEKEIDGVLSRLQSLLGGPDLSNGRPSQKARQIYYQTLVLQKFHPEDVTQAFTKFQQIESLNSSSPWTLAGITKVAEFFEDVEDSRLATEQNLRFQMIDVYQALHSILESTKSTNRAAVKIKLAKLYIADGEFEAAKNLTKDETEDTVWLPIFASLAEADGDLRKSETLWQRLEELLPAGGDNWWTARMNRIEVLHQLDASQAKIMLDRTISLYPNAQPSIITRLQELADQWETK